MTLVQGLAYGIGLLIALYLAVKNAPGLAQIFGATASGVSDVSKTLQGR